MMSDEPLFPPLPLSPQEGDRGVDTTNGDYRDFTGIGGAGGTQFGIFAGETPAYPVRATPTVSAVENSSLVTR